MFSRRYIYTHLKHSKIYNVSKKTLCSMTFFLLHTWLYPNNKSQIITHSRLKAQNTNKRDRISPKIFSEIHSIQSLTLFSLQYMTVSSKQHNSKSLQIHVWRTRYGVIWDSKQFNTMTYLIPFVFSNNFA